MNEVTAEEVKALMTAIKNRYDLDFTCYEMKSLKRRISRSLSIFGLTSTHELWTKVLRENGFIHLLVNELSVGLTAMFRDPKLWRRLKFILPKLIEEKGDLRVWHAGCSTGEEVYSFNILLEELGLRNKVQSLASDMNTEALVKAQEGRYHLIKLKEYQKNYQQFTPLGDLSKYYEIDGDDGCFDRSLIDNVKFLKSNLITDKIEGEFDIIFCRNVMIYFDQIAKRNVLNKFYENLKSDGYFIIGFFDSLVTVINKEQFDFFDLPHKIFKKKITNRYIKMDDLTKKKLNLLIHLAKVDGNFHQSERSLINTIIKEQGLDPDDYNLDQIENSSAQVEHINDKTEMLYLALKLMQADGEINSRELTYCEDLAVKLGFRPEVIRQFAFKSLPEKSAFDLQIRTLNMVQNGQH